MCKTYASKWEVFLSNAKYHVIKFNFKYVPPSDPRRLLANEFSYQTYTTYPSGILGVGEGGGEGKRLIEAKEISIHRVQAGSKI